ncbi:MAG: hypothetical protein F4155_04675 [Acidimicrobiales bacterium]|nr:hypothetical protein [Acidimicrobiales bacterium]MYK70777.1 hypothetical protein [Acidimicrobiales bacterium]
MTSPVETTAAMTPQAEQHDPADGSPASGTTALTEPSPEAVADVSSGAGEQATKRRELSQNAVIGLFGGLVTVLLGALIGLMMWQFDSLSDRIDGQGDRINSLSDRIDSLGTGLRVEMDELEAGLRVEMDELEAGLRAEMDELETEMRAGFAEINAVLLDHTDRLARLETAAGLPRPDG